MLCFPTVPQLWMFSVCCAVPNVFSFFPFLHFLSFLLTKSFPLHRMSSHIRCLSFVECIVCLFVFSLCTPLTWSLFWWRMLTSIFMMRLLHIFSLLYVLPLFFNCLLWSAIILKIFTVMHAIVVKTIFSIITALASVCFLLTCFCLRSG